MLLHNSPVGLVLRGSIFYYRRRVPLDIRAIVGRSELWKSLRTDSKALAIRRLPSVVAKVESEFEYLRHKAGLTVDHTLLEPLQHDAATLLPDRGYIAHSRMHEPFKGNDGGACPTLAEVYKCYMDDPTNGWTETTRQAYQTTHALVVSVLGAELAITDVSRVEVRTLIEVLRFLSKNAVKIFPPPPSHWYALASALS